MSEDTDRIRSVLRDDFGFDVLRLSDIGVDGTGGCWVHFSAKIDSQHTFEKSEFPATESMDYLLYFQKAGRQGFKKAYSTFHTAAYIHETTVEGTSYTAIPQPSSSLRNHLISNCNHLQECIAGVALIAAQAKGAICKPTLDNVLITPNGLVIFDTQPPQHSKVVGSREIGLLSELLTIRAKTAAAFAPDMDYSTLLDFISDTKKSRRSGVRAALLHPYLLSRAEIIDELLSPSVGDTTSDIRSRMAAVIEAAKNFVLSKKNCLLVQLSCLREFASLNGLLVIYPRDVGQLCELEAHWGNFISYNLNWADQIKFNATNLAHTHRRESNAMCSNVTDRREFRRFYAWRDSDELAESIKDFLTSYRTEVLAILHQTREMFVYYRYTRNAEKLHCHIPCSKGKSSCGRANEC